LIKLVLRTSSAENHLFRRLRNLGPPERDLSFVVDGSWPMPGAPAGEFIATLLTFKTTF